MLNPIAQTYEDIQPLIFDLCHKFKRRYGGEFEELVGEANEYFVRAYIRFYNHTDHPFWHYGGQFVKRIGYSVWVQMLDKYRTKRTRAVRLPRIPLGDHPQHSRFDLEGLLREVSDDAAHTIKLAVDLPPEVLRRVYQKDKLSRPKAKRSALIEYLTELGWSMARVLESFKEIAEALA